MAPSPRAFPVRHGEALVLAPTVDSAVELLVELRRRHASFAQAAPPSSGTNAETVVGDRFIRERLLEAVQGLHLAVSQGSGRSVAGLSRAAGLSRVALGSRLTRKLREVDVAWKVVRHLHEIDFDALGAEVLAALGGKSPPVSGLDTSTGAQPASQTGHGVGHRSASMFEPHHRQQTPLSQYGYGKWCCAVTNY